MAQLTSEFWLISAPGEKTCQQTWEVMNNVTAKQNNLSINHKFHVPDLKVSIYACTRVTQCYGYVAIKCITNSFTFSHTQRVKMIENTMTEISPPGAPGGRSVLGK